MNDRTRRWLIRGGLAVALLVALGYGAIFFYANVLNDSPDAFGSEDLTEAVSATDTTSPTTAGPTSAAPTPSTPLPTSPAVTSGDPTPAPTPAPTAAPTTAAPEKGVDGTWTLTPASEFGYRVEEVLAGVNATAVGRSNEVEGSMTIEGPAVTEGDFTVDVASITSDESRRDGQFRGRIMETDQFPTATFTLTAPIDLGEVPAAGEQVTATATGDLTLHGVTRPVTFEVTAERGEGRIGVLGSIPVQFADYEIENPSFGTVTTEDNGLLEFVLVFEPAA